MCTRGGAVLGSACSGAVLLGEAGLLTDREATIHWGYVATLTRNYKGVRVKPDQSLVLSGEAQRVLMAGGGSSWQDLALYLIARYVGLRKATSEARVQPRSATDQINENRTLRFRSLLRDRCHGRFSPEAACGVPRKPQEESHDNERSSKDQNKVGQNRHDGIIALPNAAIAGCCEPVQDKDQHCAGKPYDQCPP